MEAPKEYFELLKRGVDTREIDGNPHKAIDILISASRLVIDNKKEYAGVLGQIALCYQHLGDYDSATRYYKHALRQIYEIDDRLGEVRIIRQMAAIELKRGEYKKALILAHRAKTKLDRLDTQPNDACHITHGIVKTLIAIRDQEAKKKGFRKWLSLTKEIFFWLSVERKEVKTMLKNETSALNRNVWLTGYLSDLAYFLPPFTLPFGALGLLIAKKNHLGLRINQFHQKGF